MTGAELEFTLLSISERYKPYKEIMSALFYRTLSMIGVEDPRAFATNVERVPVCTGILGARTTRWNQRLLCQAARYRLHRLLSDD
jgi:hypothetical protein